jgi:hypothetical protein
MQMENNRYFGEVTALAEQLVKTMPADLLWEIAAVQGLRDSIGGAEYRREIRGLQNKNTLATFFANVLDPASAAVEVLDEGSEQPVYVLADGSAVYEKRRDDFYPLSPAKVEEIRARLEPEEEEMSRG